MFQQAEAIAVDWYGKLVRLLAVTQMLQSVDQHEVVVVRDYIITLDDSSHLVQPMDAPTGLLLTTANNNMRSTVVNIYLTFL